MTTQPNSSPDTDNALLVVDTDETQAYLFESNKLPEIRGASLQLKELNEQIGKRLMSHGHEVIYSSGGGLVAEVPLHQAAELAQEIESVYPQRTGAATITAVYRPLPPATDDEYGTVVHWASYLLRRRKESKGAVPFMETLAHQARCPSCQKRPASTREPVPWCDVCANKRQAQERDTWIEEFSRDQTNYQAYLRGTAVSTKIEHAQDLSELGAASHARPGYVGLIYLDGDSIGALLQTVRHKETYQKLSISLDAVTQRAVFSALAEHLQPTEVEGGESRREVGQPQLVGERFLIHPFEIIAIGGDDVILLVPAHAAIPIALDIGETFGREMTAVVRKLGLPWPKSVSMSGGVVMADDHTPVRVLYDLAHQLQDEAKKLDGGGLDFQLLKSADMLGSRIPDFRKQYPYTLAGKGKNSKDLHLLARPYTYAQLRQLWRGLEKLKEADFANSQMHLLANALLDGKAASTLFYEYQRHRTQDNAYDILQQLLVDLQGQGDTDPLPWQQVGGDEPFSHRTSLWDIAELYDFVSVLAKGEQNG